MVPLPEFVISLLFSKTRLKRKDCQEIARLPWSQAYYSIMSICLEAMQYKTLSAASGVAYEEARHLSRP
jgi:hypothetical protein